MIRWIARVAGLCLPLSAFVICIDVVTRNFGYQIPGMGSTRLQEFEWHLHGVLILLWIGYVNQIDGHVRIDVISSQLSKRAGLWLELLGLFAFALPYASYLFYNSIEFASISYLQDESSPSSSGLHNLWIIKGVMCFGLMLLWFSVFNRILITITGISNDS